MTVNGRHARFYFADAPGTRDRFHLAVTYHKRIRGRTRQLTISPRLLNRMLTTTPRNSREVT